MTLLEQLRQLPPTATLPVSWILERIEAEQGGEVPPPTDDADLSVVQLAEELRRSQATIRTWLGDEKTRALFGAYKLKSRDWRIPRAGIHRFLAAEAKRATLPQEPRKPRGRGKAADDLSSWRDVYPGPDRKAG